tara:strand:+ start:185 stop:1273 length:1089 start_codon:yes stop_codon:yes gene_type:complete
MEKKLFFLTLIFLIGIIGVVSATMISQPDGNYEVSIDLREGWNIIAGTVPEDAILPDSEIQLSDIKAMWYYSPKSNEYIRVYPNPETTKLQQADDDIVLTSAMWIYTEKSGTLKYDTLEDYPDLDNRQLYAGWNFMSVTPDMKDKFLKDIEGDCQIESAFSYDITGQTWTGFSSTDQYFGDYDIGRGIVIKVVDNCKFNSSFAHQDSENADVPDFPDSYGLNCSDSDNGKDYFTKGEITKGSNIGSDECNTNGQFGSNPNLLREYFCNNDEIDAEWYACPGSCEDGKCVDSSSSTEGCEDSDKGKDYYTKGTASNSTYLDSDHCTYVQNEDYYYIYEVYCEGNAVKSEQVNCTNGCSNGACI